MKQIEILKMYAKNRRLPLAIKLGSISAEWMHFALDKFNSTKTTNEQALEQRQSADILGTEIDNYENLIGVYSQKYITYQLDLDPVFACMKGIHHLRFAVLEPRSTIPFHLDEPFTLRFVCMLEGRHTFKFETGDEYDMRSGDLWFINGSYRHSVENLQESKRVALLGKFQRNDENLRLINELL